MTRRVLLVHYTPPGVVGGVEHIMHQHASLLSARGYQVRFAAGRRGRSPFPISVVPGLDAARPESIALDAELSEGVVSSAFREACRAVSHGLAPLIADADIVIAHNAFTLHFSLPLTSFLWDSARERPPGSTIAWCHDLSWCNPLYTPAMHEGYPWKLLRSRAPHTTYVTVSEERRSELAQLWGADEECIAVVPNGIDPSTFFRLSKATRAIVERFRLFERDIVALLPVRITRRKNIEAGIRAIARLAQDGLDICFVISGPVAPHHPSRSRSYLSELKALCATLGVEDRVVFLSDVLGTRLDNRTVAELYSVSDVLLFPSAQEGFGLPILEAGLARTPAVLSHIPIFMEIARNDADYFDLSAAADVIAEQILLRLDNESARLFRRVLREYRWDAVMDKCFLPLLATDSAPPPSSVAGTPH